MDVTGLLWILLIMVLSAIPLNIAVKILGGKSSIVKVIFANIIIAVLAYFIQSKVGSFVGLLSFVVMLFVYKVMFDMGWLRSFLAWLLQYVLIVLFFVLLILAGIFTLV
ncbi:MAG: hypothetical protein ACQESF_01505 [Nanobdellota archaeon]